VLYLKTVNHNLIITYLIHFMITPPTQLETDNKHQVLIQTTIRTEDTAAEK
jgi:hypothetical protein